MHNQKIEKKKIKGQFIKALFLAFIIIMGLETCLYIMEVSGLLPEPYEWGNRPDIPYKFNECQELFTQNSGKLKVVTVGDSRPELAFDPFFFDALFTNKTISFNLASSGTKIKFQSLYIQKMIIEKMQPDVLIWDVSYWEFYYADPSRTNEEEILNFPETRFYAENTQGLDFFGLLNYYLYRYSKIYRYKSLLWPDSMKSQNLKNFPPYDRGFWRSEVVSYQSGESGIIPFQALSEGKTYNAEANQMFLDTLDYLLEKNITVLVVYGPYNHKKIVFPELDATFSTLPSDMFLDLNGNESLMDDSLSHNAFHLNKYGAQIYTQFVYDKIHDRIQV